MSNNIFISFKEVSVAYFNRFKDVIALAGLEATLAKQTIPQIIIALLFFALFAFATWISLLMLALLVMVSYGFSWIASAACIVGINILALLGLLLTLKTLKKQLTFQATRRQIRDFNKLPR